MENNLNSLVPYRLVSIRNKQIGVLVDNLALKPLHWQDFHVLGSFPLSCENLSTLQAYSYITCVSCQNL